MAWVNDKKLRHPVTTNMIPFSALFSGECIDGKRFITKDNPQVIAPDIVYNLNKSSLH